MSFFISVERVVRIFKHSGYLERSSRLLAMLPGTLSLTIDAMPLHQVFIMIIQYEKLAFENRFRYKFFEESFPLSLNLVLGSSLTFQNIFFNGGGSL